VRRVLQTHLLHQDLLAARQTIHDLQAQLMLNGQAHPPP